MKLKVNDVILVHGWIMLKGLENGQKYKVQSMPNYHNTPTYQFTKAKGKKVVARHIVNNVDPWVNNPQNLNQIEVITLVVPSEL